MTVSTFLLLAVVVLVVTAPFWLQPILCRRNLKSLRHRFTAFEATHSMPQNRPLEQAREAIAQAEIALAQRNYEGANLLMCDAAHHLNDAYEVWRFRNVTSAS